MAQVFLGLGSNQGKRKSYLRKALKEIEALGEHMVASHVYRTKPYGFTHQPDFLNMVVRIETSLAPEDLLEKLLDIESRLGRIRQQKWGPRTIDIDLLFYDQHIIKLPHLVVPHPDLHNRDFVLRPMMDIDPDFFHPELKKTIRELWNILKEAHPPQEKES
ncbi:2-amino-4-hydroxy-6-hydroxymethyldihydropteridine diphosphokinase [Thermospira aquatica]|uniref:2-amino-4-hydroxy-6-hydroxymethyldihydropteridine pyrophosphokinase n=1 Tax=Thermospira aquatica TaxID=2828656 RepID=A0AAX3BF67_9SPIR|nr:2-amino-4-hydroxy-6-hydroxymethyldihydropteridine diphosphokinase [Thermospira aquatica]URA10993.1 2-amino-4-hydroxy-6-hydroxymethyldihydropteridine diphosphokinase [Thermospira aquatica]